MTLTCPFCKRDDHVVVIENPSAPVRYWRIVAMDADARVISIDEWSENVLYRRHRPHQLRCLSCRASFPVPNSYVIHFIQNEEDKDIIPFGDEEEDESPNYGEDV